MSTPHDPTPQFEFLTTAQYPGSLSLIVPAHRASLYETLQRSSASQTWRVKARISDHIPIFGTIDSILKRPSEHILVLSENPLNVYLHRGGHDATYFSLVGDASGRLSFIEVEIEVNTPHEALLHAREPIDELLDAISRPYRIPLVIQRLELLAADDDDPIAFEVALPYSAEIRLGPLGGIVQVPLFAPYDAILREALTNGSPFYRVLCACRLYEGIGAIRRCMKKECGRLNILNPLPKDAALTPEELAKFALPEEFLKDIRRLKDLFEKCRPLRDSIAHFLYEGKGGAPKKWHVYIASGGAFREYSVISSILLHFTATALDELRKFYQQHLHAHFFKGSILPVPNDKHCYPARVRKPS